MQEEIARKEAELAALKAKQRQSEARKINEAIKASALMKKGPALGANAASKNYGLSGYTAEQLAELRAQTSKLNTVVSADEQRRADMEAKARAEAELMKTTMEKLSFKGYRAHARVGSWRWAYESVLAFLHEMPAEEKESYFRLQAAAYEQSEQPEGPAGAAAALADAGPLAGAHHSHSLADGAAHAKHAIAGGFRRVGRRIFMFAHLGGQSSTKQERASRHSQGQGAPGASSITDALQVLSQASVPTVLESMSHLSTEEREGAVVALQRLSRATTTAPNATTSLTVPAAGDPEAKEQPATAPDKPITRLNLGSDVFASAMPGIDGTLAAYREDRVSLAASSQEEGHGQEVASTSSKVPRMPIGAQGGAGDDVFSQVGALSKRIAEDITSRISGISPPGKPVAAAARDAPAATLQA